MGWASLPSVLRGWKQHYEAKLTWCNFSWSLKADLFDSMKSNGMRDTWWSQDWNIATLWQTYISTPVHTPAKMSFLSLPGHLDMPRPWFSALFFCRTYCKFSCQGFLRDTFLFLLKNWNALLLSSLFCSPRHFLSSFFSFHPSQQEYRLYQKNKFKNHLAPYI